MYLYHVCGALDNEEMIYQALKEGLTSRTSSIWGSSVGGKLYLDLINESKKNDTDGWMDFTKAFSVMMSPKTFSNYLRFPFPKNQAYTFNLEIAWGVFAYIEDEYMEDEDGLGSMTKGLPSKETLMQQYWESRMTLADYLNKKPYPKPEIVIFQEIPPYLLDGFINKKKI